MSHKSVSERSTLPDRASEPGRVCDRDSQDQPFTDNYTYYRSTYGEDDDVSPTEPGDSTTQPRILTSVDTEPEYDPRHVTNGTGPNYTYQQYAHSSANTDSTLRASDLYMVRSHLSYFANRDHHDGSTQPLTMDAIAALNYTNDTETYSGDVSSWIPQLGRGLQADQTNDWSTSNLMPHGPRSQTSVNTGSSGYIVPSTQDYQTADLICNAGVWSDDAPADPYATRASSIRDEDVFDGQL